MFIKEPSAPSCWEIKLLENSYGKIVFFSGKIWKNALKVLVSLFLHVY